MSKETTEQDSITPPEKRNPEGKGGFGDHPENINAGGRPKNADSFAYWFTIFKNMTNDELADWETETPEGSRTVAASLALVRVKNALNDLKEFQEVADRSEGRPRQAVDITSGGQKIQPATVVDLGNLSGIADQSEAELNSDDDQES